MSEQDYRDMDKIAHIAEDKFWLFLEQLGNRSESLDAPLSPEILLTIKQLVDCNRAWWGFGTSLPQFEFKLRQLNLWDE